MEGMKDLKNKKSKVWGQERGGEDDEDGAEGEEEEKSEKRGQEEE